MTPPPPSDILGELKIKFSRRHRETVLFRRISHPFLYFNSVRSKLSQESLLLSIKFEKKDVIKEIVQN
jgi:hypothetical protein